MIWLFILLGILGLLLLGVCLLPFSLVINSQEEQYLIRIGKWLTIRLVLAAGLPAVAIKAPFYEKVYGWEDLTGLRKQKRKGRKRPKKKPKRLTVSKIRRVVLNARKSFQVKRFHVIVNTGDPLWNAWLYPLGYLLGMPRDRFQVAFHLPTTVDLQIDNRVGRLGWAVAKAFIYKPSKKIKL
ncbi:MAG TPA: hypothetical protein DCE41_31860 [Cytophagales bacterium]|nr:hypothetical protein [Cytophagales bacterium]HAA18452.1 hypothetical protein [Cytophagales bacterium]HAP61592.1 hypothetical protein [Cytophagales bacterium]